MSEIIIYLDLAMVVLDIITISDLRRFLLDFLQVNNSRKNAKRIYDNHCLKEKVLLSFIKMHLKKYFKEFVKFHRLYLAVMYTLIPQYVILIVSNIILQMKSLYVLCTFAAIKLFISFLIRINVDSNRISIYRKK